MAPAEDSDSLAAGRRGHLVPSADHPGDSGQLQSQ